MTRILSLILCLFVVFSTFAQNAIGDWISYNAFTKITNVEETKDKVYYVSGGNLFSYNKEDNSVAGYSKVEGLSDFDIIWLQYNNATNQLVVVYSNLNIDLIIGERLYNISDIKDKTVSGDKAAYHFSENGKYMLISTGFGLVVLDLERREVKDSFNWSKKIKSAVMKGDMIYVSSDDFGIKIGDVNDNLSDFSKWKTLTSSFAPIDLFNIDDKIYCLKSTKDVCVQNGDADSWIKILNHGSLTKLKKTADNKLIAYGKNMSRFYIINSDNSFITRVLPNNINDISSYSNNMIFWCGDLVTNLTSYRFTEDNNVNVEISGIGFNGVGTNYPFHMTFVNGYLYVSGGGKAANRLGYTGMVSRFDGNQWINTDADAVNTAVGTRFRDVVHTLVDPTDPTHMYCFTWGEGIFEFKNDECVNLYTYKNSGVESIFDNNPNYIRVDGGAYDMKGNLWFTNTEIANQVKILPKNGSWEDLKILKNSDLENNNSLGKVFVSTRNYKWITIDRTKKMIGFLVVDNSGDVDNISGFKTKFFSSITYNDGNSQSMEEITSIKGWAEDNYGKIWIGTDKGPFVVNNEANIFRDNTVAFSRIKVARNDGTDLADFLLESEDITAIAIDGGNRKWFATSSSGVYLVSDDCQDEIYHFTTENSPLPSNNVMQLAIDNNSGVVYFGTEKGLIAYQSDANQGKTDYSDVYAFPNPVRPDYSGVITVTGLMENSLVKITDVNNNLIYQTTSLGGMAGWNGLNSSGERVATGVYFVYGTSEDGKKGVVTKILFVK